MVRPLAPSRGLPSESAELLSCAVTSRSGVHRPDCRVSDMPRPGPEALADTVTACTRWEEGQGLSP